METQASNAKKVAEYLQQHPKVEKVYYLGFIKESNPEQYDTFKRQCLSAGAMVSFDIKGGEKEAFLFLNHLQLMKLAVSLGSTESLAEHPASMTHSDVPPEERAVLDITDKLVRLSIGVENSEDIIWDITQALESIA